MPERQGFTNDIMITIDPIGVYRHHSNERIINSAGLIINFVSDMSLGETIKERLENGYHPIKCYWNQCDNQHPGKASVYTNLTFQFPNDPLLYPVLVYRRVREIAVQYNNAVICYSSDRGGSWQHCIMD